MYQLEGKAVEAGLAYEPLVAVSCTSKMNTGNRRCHLDEFLKYLWAEQVGHDGELKNTPYPHPNPRVLSPYSDEHHPWHKEDLTKIFSAILKSGFVDGVRGNRLVRGATNFWTARIRVTEPIAQLQARVGQFNDPALVQDLIDKATEANKAAYMMRLMDYEKYRIRGGSLSQQLSDRREVKTRLLETGIKGYTFQALDAEATLMENKDLTQAELQAACDRVRSLPRNSGHWVALQAGRAALTYGGCTVPKLADITL